MGPVRVRAEGALGRGDSRAEAPEPGQGMRTIERLREGKHTRPWVEGMKKDW